MQGRRTDLALESKLFAEKSARALTEEDGVRAEEERLFGYPLTAVEILSESGAAALRKPVGRYLTLTLNLYRQSLLCWYIIDQTPILVILLFQIRLSDFQLIFRIHH